MDGKSWRLRVLGALALVAMAGPALPCGDSKAVTKQGGAAKKQAAVASKGTTQAPRPPSAPAPAGKTAAN